MWQGRYSLALYLCLLIVAGLALDDAFPAAKSAITRKALLAGAYILGAAHVVTFVLVLRRYVVGTQFWAEMLQAPDWQPPLGWIALTVIYAAAWAVALWFTHRWTGGGHDTIRVNAIEKTSDTAVEK
jgi:hypothetical protein